MSPDTVILLTGSCAAVACALVGTFLVLRGMALIGDAISHAVLPGIVIAFLLTDSVSSLPVVLGAGALGLVTVWLIESLVRTRRVKEDASIAVVFPALFAVGVLLVTRFAHGKDLDAECVLYGEIAFAPFDTMTLWGMVISRPLVALASVAALNLVFVVALYKELKIATFDGALAATLGMSPVLVHYLLMGTVSVTTVASFESVGAILVVAFLIVPGSAAWLWTDKLHWMLTIAAAIGVTSAFLGFHLAVYWDASIAGCMALAMGGCFVLSWIFAPREGLFGRWNLRRVTRERFAEALLLERLARAPGNATEVAAEFCWTAEQVARHWATVTSQKWITATGNAWQTNEAGRAQIQKIVGD